MADAIGPVASQPDADAMAVEQQVNDVEGEGPSEGPMSLALVAIHGHAAPPSPGANPVSPVEEAEAAAASTPAEEAPEAAPTPISAAAKPPAEALNKPQTLTHGTFL